MATTCEKCTVRRLQQSTSRGVARWRVFLLLLHWQSSMHPTTTMETEVAALLAAAGATSEAAVQEAENTLAVKVEFALCL